MSWRRRLDFGGLSLQETAEVLRVSVATVRGSE